MNEQKGKLVILSGPSGVGKSTISRELVRRLGAYLSVSATTRPMGAGEVDGKDYRFLTREEFEAMLDDNRFIEYAEVFGNYYGTPRESVEKAMAEGKVVILEIDVQGGRQVQKQYPEALSIFILPPKRDALLERLSGRNRGENEEARRLRLEEAGREIAAGFQYYDYQVVNDDLEQAIREVIEIIEGKTKEKP